MRFFVFFLPIFFFATEIKAACGHSIQNITATTISIGYDARNCPEFHATSSQKVRFCWKLVGQTQTACANSNAARITTSNQSNGVIVLSGLTPETTYRIKGQYRKRRCMRFVFSCIWIESWDQQWSIVRTTGADPATQNAPTLILEGTFSQISSRRSNCAEFSWDGETLMPNAVNQNGALFERELRYKRTTTFAPGAVESINTIAIQRDATDQRFHQTICDLRATHRYGFWIWERISRGPNSLPEVRSSNIIEFKWR